MIAAGFLVPIISSACYRNTNADPDDDVTGIDDIIITQLDLVARIDCALFNDSTFYPALVFDNNDYRYVLATRDGTPVNVCFTRLVLGDTRISTRLNNATLYMVDGTPRIFYGMNQRSELGPGWQVLFNDGGNWFMNQYPLPGHVYNVLEVTGNIERLVAT